MVRESTDAEDARQVLDRSQGPVGEAVQHSLFGGLQDGGEQVVGGIIVNPEEVVVGQAQSRGWRFPRHPATEPKVSEDLTKGQEIAGADASVAIPCRREATLPRGSPAPGTPGRDSGPGAAGRGAAAPRLA